MAHDYDANCTASKLNITPEYLSPIHSTIPYHTIPTITKYINILTISCRTMTTLCSQRTTSGSQLNYQTWSRSYKMAIIYFSFFFKEEENNFWECQCSNLALFMYPQVSSIQCFGPPGNGSPSGQLEPHGLSGGAGCSQATIWPDAGRNGQIQINKNNQVQALMPCFFSLFFKLHHFFLGSPKNLTKVL